MWGRYCSHCFDMGFCHKCLEDTLLITKRQLTRSGRSTRPAASCTERERDRVGLTVMYSVFQNVCNQCLLLNECCYLFRQNIWQVLLMYNSNSVAWTRDTFCIGLARLFSSNSLHSYKKSSRSYTWSLLRIHGCSKRVNTSNSRYWYFSWLQYFLSLQYQCEGTPPLCLWNVESYPENYKETAALY
jgi:hypothetical protein